MPFLSLPNLHSSHTCSAHHPLYPFLISYVHETHACSTTHHPHLTMSLPSFLSISPLPTITVTPPHSISTIIPIIPPHNRIFHTHFLPLPISYLYAWESCMHGHPHGHLHSHPPNLPCPSTTSLSTPHTLHAHRFLTNLHHLISLIPCTYSHPTIPHTHFSL